MPVHEMVVIIACANAQMPKINANAGASGEHGCLNFSLSNHLHLYYVYASSEGSGESAHMRICADSPEPSLLARDLVHWPILWKQKKTQSTRKRQTD